MDQIRSIRTISLESGLNEFKKLDNLTKKYPDSEEANL